MFNLCYIVLKSYMEFLCCLVHPYQRLPIIQNDFESLTKANHLNHLASCSLSCFSKFLYSFLCHDQSRRLEPRAFCEYWEKIFEHCMEE